MTIARRPIASIAQVDGLQGALDGKEAALGNPASSGLVLASTTAGVRSWVDAPRERVIASVSALSTNHPASWSADAGTDVLTSSVAHGLTVNTPIAFGAGTGALPGGLAAEPEYYWVIAAPTTTTLQVSLTFGGAAVDITSAGTAGWVVKNTPSAATSLPLSIGSLKSAGRVSLYWDMQVMPRHPSGWYPLLAFSGSGVSIFATSANTVAQGGTQVGLFGSATTKKYNRVVASLDLSMVTDSLISGVFQYSVVGATDAALTANLAYVNTIIGIYGTITDITSVSLTCGYSGRVQSGSSSRAIAAAR